MTGKEPRIAFLTEPDFRHAFPVLSLLRVLRAPLITCGKRFARRLVGMTEVLCVPERDFPMVIAERELDIVITTSQIIHPDKLREKRPGLRIVFVGHGESDKTRGFGPDPKHLFHLNPVNMRFDLLLIASYRHLEESSNPNRELIGYLKHDLFCHGGYSSVKPREDWLLWAPGWGRHSAVKTWLAPVAESAGKLGLTVILHFHPYSFFHEPEVVQEAQCEVLRHGRVRIAQCLNVLDVMARCSLMLGDVSSVCYDWLMFDRPMIFLDHEHLMFQEEKRLFSVGPVVKPQEDLAGVIKEELDSPGSRQALRRRALSERFFKLDGHAADRALDAILSYWRTKWASGHP